MLVNPPVTNGQSLLIQMGTMKPVLYSNIERTSGMPFVALACSSGG
ncbi:unnamed protein product [Camellia sinensis]